MNSYLLVGADDNGIHTVRVAKAVSIQGAIEDKFEFAPLDLDKIIKEMQDAGELTPEEVRLYLTNDPKKPLEGEFISWDGRRVKETVTHTIRERATAFFNLELASNYNRRAVGNYVDGDSTSSWTIFEITSDGSVLVYPTPQTLMRE